jgi:hypothetical protein
LSAAHTVVAVVQIRFHAAGIIAAVAEARPDAFSAQSVTELTVVVIPLIVLPVRWHAQCAQPLVAVKPENLAKTVRYYDSSKCMPDKFQYALYPAHPTFFVKKWVYEKYGVFKTDYKIGADFDIMARFLYTNKISYSYIKEPFIKMRIGGVSTSFSSIWINSLEQLRVCRENNIKTNIFKILMKYPIKLLGMTKK